jgi:hypothetical protein
MHVSKAVRPQQHNRAGPEITVTSSVGGRDACTSALYVMFICVAHNCVYTVIMRIGIKERVETIRG